MPTYTLIPDEHDYEAEELIADGPGQLLAMVYRYGWNAARVLQDGRYIFTVALDSNGVWSILPGLPDSDDNVAVQQIGCASTA